MTGGNRDALLLILDTDGNFNNYKTFGGLDKESFHDLAVRNHNRYLTGITEKDIGDKESMIIALENQTNSVNTTISLEDAFTSYPNPSRGIATFGFSNREHKECTIQLYNSLGHLIGTYFIDSNTQNITMKLYQSGLLFIEISFPQYRITRKLINTN